MSLEARLALELTRKHPERAAAVLERLEVADSAEVLSRGEAEDAANLLERLSPSRAEALLARLELDRVRELFEALGHDAASRLARGLEPTRRAALLQELPASRGHALRNALRFPPHSAGALMDPDVLALPQDLEAREALDRVREQPERARYNVYVLDSEQKLVGALNLRELFLAEPTARLRDMMVASPLALPAHLDRAQIAAYPGWREVHSLPVVDESGVYLGALRYRTLREIEDLLMGGSNVDSRAPDALGELFAAGAGGLLGAITGSAGGATGGGS